LLEFYFTYKLKWNKANSTAVNLPIFKSSIYRSWDLKPNTFTKAGFENPIPIIKINSK